MSGSGARLGQSISLVTLIKYLREKDQLTVNPKYRYDMRHLIMSLNNASIDTIKQEFQLNDNHINLQKFIWLIKQAIKEEDDAQDDYLVYYQLVKLFEEIDIDNSDTIEWAELLQYLSESAWLSAPSIPKKNVNSVENRILYHAFKQQTKYRKNLIKHIVQIQRHHTLAILTKNSLLSFVNYKIQQEAHEQQSEQRSQGGFCLNYIDPTRVLSIDYSEEERLFGVLMSNRNLCFIEEGEMQKNHGIIRSTGAEIQIKYLHLHRLWVLESANCTLQVFPSPKMANVDKKIVFRPHIQPLTAIREVGNPLTICTASLDGIIKLWQVSSGRLVIQLNVSRQRTFEQKKGVKGVATYNRGLLSYICSWMFTTEIFLWLPSLSLSKPFAGQLKGHLGLVLDCQFSWKGELVSVDDKRIVKVWNPQRFQCIQNFMIQEQGSSLFVLRAKPYVIVYAKLMDFYRIKTNSKADLQAEIHMAGQSHNVLYGQGQSPRLLTIQFSPYYCFLVIITTHDVKIMDINSSALVATMYPPPGDEFIFACLKTNRRLYVATSLGIILQYKIQDGTVTRRIVVCQEAGEEELKFIYFHQDTKMLLAIIEKPTASFIVTFDQLNAEEDIRIKQIQFQQTGLVDFLANEEGVHRFFILSAQPSITIWDYQKLVILTRLDFKHIIGCVHNPKIIFEPNSQNLLLNGQKEVAVVRLDYNSNVCSISTVYLHNEHHNSNDIVCISLAKQRVPNSFIEQLKIRKTKRNIMLENRKKVDFIMFDKEQKQAQGEYEQSFEDVFILAAADNVGEVFYYNMNELIKESFRNEKQTIKGKLQRVKQHRKAHMKPDSYKGKTTKYNYNQQHLFIDQSTFIPKIDRAGFALGYFYFHTSDNILHFLTPYGINRGEWALSLPKPKAWNVTFNEIDLVLQRLSRTEKALESLFHMNSVKFKTQFLLTKYLTNLQISQLQRYEQRKKQQVRSWSMFSRHELNSKKSILSINEKLGSSNMLEKDNIFEAVLMTNIQIKKDTENIFEKKLQEKERQKLVRRNNKNLFERIKKSLSYSKNLGRASPQPSFYNLEKDKEKQKIEDKPSIISQVENIFTASIKNKELFLQNSSTKSIKKQPSNRRTSLNNLLSIKNSEQIKQPSNDKMKMRIKSSLSELSKNFIQTKIDWRNFNRQRGQNIAKRSSKLKL